MGKHLAGLPSGRLHRRCFVDLRSTEIVPLTNNSRDCTTGWQNQSDRQTGMPSLLLDSCKAVHKKGQNQSFQPEVSISCSTSLICSFDHYHKGSRPFQILRTSWEFVSTGESDGNPKLKNVDFAFLAILDIILFQETFFIYSYFQEVLDLGGLITPHY